MTVEVEKGKTLTVKLLAVGPLDQNKGTRECFFELNGETRAVVITDSNAAIEHVSREKASEEPGSVGSPLSGVVVDVRVKEGQEVKAGDPVSTIDVQPLLLYTDVTACRHERYEDGDGCFLARVGCCEARARQGKRLSWPG